MCLAMSPFACWPRDLHRWRKIQEFLVRILPFLNRPRSSML